MGDRPRFSAFAAALLVATVVCACGHRTTQQTTEVVQREHGRLANPSDFPLYPRSEIVTVVPVNSAQMFAAIRASDPTAKLPKNFRGHEIIAETGASMPQLQAWVRGLRAAPPRGLHDATDSDRTAYNSNDSKDVAVGASFETANGERSVFVVAADPKKLRDALGPAFALIDNYAAVPGVLRGPIDEQAKQQFGYSVTEMLDAKSPVGAAVAAVRRLQSSDRRAILVVDESKAQ